MARFVAVLIGASLAAVCLATSRQDVSSDQAPTLKMARVEKDVEVIEHPIHPYQSGEDRRRHFRHHRHEAENFHHYGEREDEFPHHSHQYYRHRHHHHHHHHDDGHSLDRIVFHFIARLGQKSGLNRTDVHKLVRIVRDQMNANKQDLRQDRSNWTEPQFRAQFKRMETRVHEDVQKLASQQIADTEHLTAFFTAAEAKREQFKRHVFAIEKARLQRFATAANVSAANFELFMSILQANPIEVIPRKQMSLEERMRVLDALNTEWKKIKELSTQGMDDEDKQKVQTFFEAVEKDFLDNMHKRHHRPGHHHGRHFFDHHEQRRHYNRYHGHYHERQHFDGSEEEPEVRYHHRIHRHRHNSRHHHDDEAATDKEYLSKRLRHFHRHHDNDDEDREEYHHSRHDDEDRSELNHHGHHRHHHHHHHHAPSVKEESRKSSKEENLDNSNPRENEIASEHPAVIPQTRSYASHNRRHYFARVEE